MFSTKFMFNTSFFLYNTEIYSSQINWHNDYQFVLANNPFTATQELQQLSGGLKLKSF